MIRLGAPGAWRCILNDEERALVCARWAEGVDVDVIAREVGCSPSNVSKIAHRAGLPARRAPFPVKARAKRERPAGPRRRQSIRLAAARHGLGG